MTLTMTTAKKRGSTRRANIENRKAGRPRTPAKLKADRHHRPQMHVTRYSGFEIADDEDVVDMEVEPQERDETPRSWISDDDMTDASAGEHSAATTESMVAAYFDPITRMAQESVVRWRNVITHTKLFPNITGFNNTLHYQTLLDISLQLFQLSRDFEQQVPQLIRTFEEDTTKFDYTNYYQQLNHLRCTHLTIVKHFLHFVQDWQNVQNDNPHIKEFDALQATGFQQTVKALRSYADNPFLESSIQQIFQVSEKCIEPEVKAQSLSATDCLNLTIRLAKDSSPLMSVDDMSS